jgi:RimJ/RimL family protein N-acetyltransferase
MATNPDFKGFSFSRPSIIADGLPELAARVARCYHFWMIHEGQTERLILRPVEIGDAPQIQELFPHWEIVKYLQSRVPWPYPEGGALEFLRDVAIPQEERDEAWHWTLRLCTAPSQIIGVISLIKNKDTNRGFWLGLPWQGQGLMTEAAAWATDYWFETIGIPVLRVAKAIDNTPSRRISEKQGMRLIGVEDRDYVSGRLPSELWEITAEEWRAWKVRNWKN